MTFAPNVPQELTARQVENYLVSWPFLVYSVSILFILLPKSEKLGLLGFLQHYELVAEKLLLKINCVIFIGERASLWVIAPVPKLKICWTKRCPSHYVPGESHSCARLTRKERFWVLVGLRKNLNIGSAYISYICAHATPSACTPKLQCFSGMWWTCAFKNQAMYALGPAFLFHITLFQPMLLSLAERSFVWSWNVERRPASLPLRLIWTWVWIQIQKYHFD